MFYAVILPELMATNAKKRIVELRRDLNQHGYLYHVLNAPSLSDHDYDALFKELVDLEKEYPELYDPNSPTSRVGSPSASTFAKTKHETPMLSLDNAFNTVDVLKFFSSTSIPKTNGMTICAEPKIDGLSLELVYDEGVLVRALTRGDGAVGDDVTENARAIETVPLVLLKPITITVRGEVFIKKTVFDCLNAAQEYAGEELFSNPRNTASGAMGLKDSAEVAKRRLSFIAYAVVDAWKFAYDQRGLTAFLESVGFVSPASLGVPDEAYDVPVTDADAIDHMIQKMDDFRRTLDLITDGAVLKLENLALQKEAGVGTRSPRWAVAYKYPPERKATTLLDIEVTVGKTGKLTPLAHLEPVTIAGTVVARASLMNADEVGRIACGIGDRVEVLKSGEIIPRVVKVVKKVSLAPWKMPTCCPGCGSPVTKQEQFVDYYCYNEHCKPQVLARLRYATAKGALDLDGCGDAMIASLYANGVRKLSDLFTLSDLSFLSPDARSKFESERERVKKAPLWRKVNALCIEGIGSETSKLLVSKFKSFYAVFDNLGAVKALLGAVRYASLIDYAKRNSAEFDALEDAGFLFDADPEAQTGPLSGKTFVITGTLMTTKREKMESMIQEAGGNTKKSVTKAVDYLVVGVEPGNNKISAADRLGTPKIDEETLYQMLGVSMPIVDASVNPLEDY